MNGSARTVRRGRSAAHSVGVRGSMDVTALVLSTDQWKDRIIVSVRTDRFGWKSRVASRSRLDLEPRTLIISVCVSI